jgi:hypothetical protein
MKAFIEELNKHKAYLSDLPGKDSEGNVKHKELEKRFSEIVGRRALMKSGRAEARVVSIAAAFPHYVRVTYKCYGPENTTEISTCLDYNALICGDSRLDLE